MQDPPERPEPADPRKPARGGAPRRTRFALPTDHHDERTSERIEAFLDGPVRERRSRPRHLRSEALRRPRRALRLDTRTDWEAALRHEDARLARYGRPASVLIVDLQPAEEGMADRFAARVATIIRDHARETDRIARVSPTRFHVLLPETSEPEADVLAERVQATCRSWGSVGPGLPLLVTTAAATPIGGGTLAEALHAAQERLAD